jgi:hypothetical protein
MFATVESTFNFKPLNVTLYLYGYVVLPACHTYVIGEDTTPENTHARDIARDFCPVVFPREGPERAGGGIVNNRSIVLAVVCAYSS